MSTLTKAIRIFFIILGTLIILGVGGVFVLSFIISPDTIRDQAEKSLSDATGRVVSIAGPVDFHFFPVISVSFEGLRIAQPDNFDSKKAMLSIQRAEAGLKFMPLLTGMAEFDQVDITGLTAHLIKKSKTENNWTFGKKISPQTKHTIPAQNDVRAEKIETATSSSTVDVPMSHEDSSATNTSAAPSSTATNTAGTNTAAQPSDMNDYLARIGLPHVNIINANVSYTDESSGQVYSIQDFDLKMTPSAQASLDQVSPIFAITFDMTANAKGFAARTKPTFTAKIAAKGQAQINTAQGLDANAIKRGITSETALSMTDIVLLDKSTVDQLAKTFGGSGWQSFQSLTANVTTKDGIVRSDNIKLVSTNINATGTILANLITEALAGDAKLTIGGITLPAYVKGTFSKPAYGIATADALNSLVKGLGGLGLTSTKSSAGEASTKSNSDETSSSKSSSQKALDGLGTLLNKIGQ